MTVTRIILFIGIAVYLIGLGFLLPAINTSIIENNPDNAINYGSTNRTIASGEQQFTFITSITSLPLWFNTIFIIIPLIAEILIGITLFFPTGNAGA